MARYKCKLSLLKPTKRQKFVPAVGDQVEIRKQVYTVKEVFKWDGRYVTVLDKLGLVFEGELIRLEEGEA
ncbi:hypothetical protein DL897_17710 [Thermoflavimicrobium daqui]|jgi:hypothetical protein|uniref:Uncharacterized protein n=1 Tax=Thermoflavimicrobium daqui TaxID=2137476 RepID=A0A364K0G4_9BACL|nr:hypothetical protein DL897_17710 [Thermoflavimicrobium daqui]